MNNPKLQNETKECFDLEARRIRLASQIVALRATGFVLDWANLDTHGHPELEVAEDPLMAGFNSHVTGGEEPLRAIEPRMGKASRPMIRSALIAQTRAILAGAAALDFADLSEPPSCVGKSDVWTDCMSSGKKVLEAFIQLLAEGKDACEVFPVEVWEVLSDEIWEDAKELVASNWRDVQRVCCYLRDGHGLMDVYQWTLASPGRYLVTPGYAESMFETAEEWGLALAVSHGPERERADNDFGVVGTPLGKLFAASRAKRHWSSTRKSNSER